MRAVQRICDGSHTVSFIRHSRIACSPLCKTWHQALAGRYQSDLRRCTAQAAASPCRARTQKTTRMQKNSKKWRQKVVCLKNEFESSSGSPSRVPPREYASASTCVLLVVLFSPLSPLSLFCIYCAPPLSVRCLFTQCGTTAHLRGCWPAFRQLFRTSIWSFTLSPPPPPVGCSYPIMTTTM
jgi:hypothetical protein